MAFSKTKRVTVHDKYNGHCAYCGDPIAYEDMHIDHIIPKANFKTTIQKQTNIPDFLKHLTLEDMHHEDNLHPSCRVCNKFKDTFHLELFRSELEQQIYRLYNTSASYRRLLKYNFVKEKPHTVIFYFEKQRRYNFDGETYLLEFDSEEEKWFTSWVVMRRKFLVSENNVREVIKDVHYWRNKTYELEKIILDLKKAKNIPDTQDVIEARKREKMIEDFNNNNNKTFRKKKKKKTRPRGRRRK